MKNTFLRAALFWFLLSLEASATTWGEPQSVPDPLRQDAICKVAEPMSYGSYIYQWPSKYDQVFWPLTVPNGIWFCPESGFAAFIGEFELTANERAALAADFAIHYKPTGKSPTLREKLDRLQRSYAVRDKGSQSDIQLLRVLAYYHEVYLKDYARAAELRKQALQSIEAALRTNLQEAVRLEYLFVSAIYYREFDDPLRSAASLEALDAALKASKDDKLKGFVEYLSELKSEVQLIVPGGPLIPESR